MATIFLKHLSLLVCLWRILCIYFLDYKLFEENILLLIFLAILKKHLNVRNALIIKSSLARNQFGSGLPVVCVSECIYNDKIVFLGNSSITLKFRNSSRMESSPITPN